MKGNKTLYLFEGLACLLVVLIHIPFPGDLGIFFISVARYAVPLFFMVSGYSLYKFLEKDGYREKIKSRLKRNGKVIVIALVCYFFFDIVKCVLKGKPILQFFMGMITVPNALIFFFLGIFPHQCAGGILWFMMAQLYIYVCALLFAGRTKKSRIPAAAAVSLAVLMAASCLKVAATALRWKAGPIDLSSDWIYGNWILIGMPCFILGLGFADYMEKKRAKVTAVPVWRYLLVIGVCIVLNFILCLILDHRLDMYLSYTVFTLIIDYCAFALSQRDRISENNLLAQIGCFHSRNVYIAHPAVISGVILLFEKLHASRWGGDYIQPILVILLTLAFSMVLNSICRWMDMLKARRNV